MTQDEQMDRLERILRLLAKPDLRSTQEFREKVKKLKALAEINDKRFAEMQEALRKLANRSLKFPSEEGRD